METQTRRCMQSSTSPVYYTKAESPDYVVYYGSQEACFKDVDMFNKMNDVHELPFLPRVGDSIMEMLGYVLVGCVLIFSASYLFFTRPMKIPLFGL
jgi:hypothetical protein